SISRSLPSMDALSLCLPLQQAWWLFEGLCDFAQPVFGKMALKANSPPVRMGRPKEGQTAVALMSPALCLTQLPSEFYGIFFGHHDTRCGHEGMGRLPSQKRRKYLRRMVGEA
ncbi:MAG: hypothetical protein ACK56I_22670, partial [bacterium]